ncbi:MAG: cyclic-phosphate processing receiver domain-containing protein [Nannocystaceae bacterium]
MRLWLDDQRPMPADYEVRVTTAAEAIAALEGGEITAVSLDHDLGDEAEVGSGYQVACWIEAAAFEGRLRRLEWRVHSANPIGRRRMEAALQAADRAWSRGGD